MKFGIKHGDEASIRRIVESYIAGLFWTLQYYHHECKSWSWFYPYLYAPLASDLVNLGTLNITFPQGRPFTQLMQLLAVLPPQSGNLLPVPYNEIMTSPLSPLHDFFPSDFDVDPNGKKSSWEYTAQIPFIDEALLVQTVNQIDHATDLTEDERNRNRRGHEFRVLPLYKDSRESNAKRAGLKFFGKHSNSWGNALLSDSD